MVGPGTGVAPFRAFVQERRAIGATGRNWLFFGDRHYTPRFPLSARMAGRRSPTAALARIDLAFSRDTPEKVYVQHRLCERRRDLVDWLESGARLLRLRRCQGDGEGRATPRSSRAYADVKALAPDAAEPPSRSLEREQRYLQDVY